MLERKEILHLKNNRKELHFRTRVASNHRKWEQSIEEEGAEEEGNKLWVGHCTTPELLSSLAEEQQQQHNFRAEELGRTV